MATEPSLQLSTLNAFVSPGMVPLPAPIPIIDICLDCGIFPLWCTLAPTNFSGASLDGVVVSGTKTQMVPEPTEISQLALSCFKRDASSPPTLLAKRATGNAPSEAFLT
jgi:hypothetical protein